jgi:hypothetical protein
MPDIETVGTVAVPIWLAWLGAAAVAVSLLLAIKRAGGVRALFLAHGAWRAVLSWIR